jgi:hypothetical protein
MSIIAMKPATPPVSLKEFREVAELLIRLNEIRGEMYETLARLNGQQTKAKRREAELLRRLSAGAALE